MYLHPRFIRLCGYSLAKLRIFNLQKSTIADIATQYPLSCYLVHGILKARKSSALLFIKHAITYKRKQIEYISVNMIEELEILKA